MCLNIKIQAPLESAFDSLQNRTKKHSVKNFKEICHDANSSISCSSSLFNFKALNKAVLYEALYNPRLFYARFLPKILGFQYHRAVLD